MENYRLIETMQTALDLVLENSEQIVRVDDKEYLSTFAIKIDGLGVVQKACNEAISKYGNGRYGLVFCGDYIAVRDVDYPMAKIHETQLGTGISVRNPSKAHDDGLRHKLLEFLPKNTKLKSIKNELHLPICAVDISSLDEPSKAKTLTTFFETLTDSRKIIRIEYAGYDYVVSMDAKAKNAPDGHKLFLADRIS